MSDEQTLMNSPEARTETGTIQDQATTGEAPVTPTEPAAETATTPQVPETYDFGEGFDPKLLETATPVFKELGLTQDAAAKLVDLYKTQTAGMTDALLAQVEKTRTEWRTAVESDKEIGGILKTRVLPEIGRALDKLPSEVSKSFRESLDLTGAGDHPAVVKALYEMSKLVNEGTHVSGRGPSPDGQSAAGKVVPPSAAASLYPNLPTASR
jgi:hypothetical protein